MLEPIPATGPLNDPIRVAEARHNVGEGVTVDGVMGHDRDRSGSVAAGEALARTLVRWPKLRTYEFLDACVLSVVTNLAGAVRARRGSSRFANVLITDFESYAGRCRRVTQR